MKTIRSDTLMSAGIMAIEFEVMATLLFQLSIFITLGLVLVTGFSILFLWFFIQLSHLKEIAGHLCFSAQLFYSHDQYDIKDCLIAGYRIIEVDDEDIESFEEEEVFLDKFEEFILEQKMSFPNELKSREEKFFYFELKKRMSLKTLKRFVLDNANDDETPDKLLFAMNDKLKAMMKDNDHQDHYGAKKSEDLEEIEEIKKIESDVEIEVEPIYTEEETQKAIKKKKEKIAQDKKEEEEKVEVLKEVNKVANIGSIITIFLIIALVIFFYQYFAMQLGYLTPYFLIIPSVITIITILITRKLVKDAKKVAVNTISKKQEVELELSDPNTLKVAVNKLLTFHPYAHYTYVLFKHPYFSEQITECIVVTLQSFFKSFHFSKGFINYNQYFHRALTSPVIFEYFGEIESKFPVLYTKFSSGMVGRDEQNSLNFNLIENAKTRTYYRLLCDERNVNVTKDNDIDKLSGSRDSWKKQAIKNALYKAKEKKIADTKADPEQFEIDWTLPQQYHPLIWILLIAIVLFAIGAIRYFIMASAIA